MIYQNFVQRAARVKKMAFYSLLLIVPIYFVFHAIVGNRGIIAYFTLTRQIEQSSKELDILRTDRIELEHRVNLLKSPIDRDMLDEQARKILGIAGQDEKVFVVKPIEE